MMCMMMVVTARNVVDGHAVAVGVMMVKLVLFDKVVVDFRLPGGKVGTESTSVSMET